MVSEELIKEKCLELDRHIHKMTNRICNDDDLKDEDYEAYKAKQKLLQAKLQVLRWVIQ